MSEVGCGREGGQGDPPPRSPDLIRLLTSLIQYKLIHLIFLSPNLDVTFHLQLLISVSLSFSFRSETGCVQVCWRWLGLETVEAVRGRIEIKANPNDGGLTMLGVLTSQVLPCC